MSSATRRLQTAREEQRFVQERAALQGRSIPTILSRCLAEALATEQLVQLFRGNLPTTYAVLADLARRRNVLPPQRHVYHGERCAGPEDTQVVVDDQPLALADGARPVRFAWGAEWPGDAYELADALLRYEFGPAFPSRYVRRFADDITAHFPTERGGVEWLIDSVTIRLWFVLVQLIEEAEQVPSGGSVSMIHRGAEC